MKLNDRILLNLRTELNICLAKRSVLLSMNMSADKVSARIAYLERVIAERKNERTN